MYVHMYYRVPLKGVIGGSTKIRSGGLGLSFVLGHLGFRVLFGGIQGSGSCA